MAYTDYLGEIFKFIGLPAAISIGVGAYLKLKFDAKLEKLKSKNSKKLASFQADLDYIKTKQNFKFTKLHEIRLEVIQKTYFLLNEYLNLLKDYVQPLKSPTLERTIEENERFLSEECVAKHNELVDYFSYNLIYFDENIVNLIDRYTINSKSIFETFLKSHKLRMNGETPDEQMEESSRNVYTQIPILLYPLKEAIEIKFRELLEE